jgi:hypothetical protein
MAPFVRFRETFQHHAPQKAYADGVTLRPSGRLLLIGAAVLALSLAAGTGAFVLTRPVVTTALMHARFRLPPDRGAAFVPNADNYASRTVTTGPLLLFLAATGHRPSDYRDFLATARHSGYHVLALDYWNTGWSVQRTCRADASCYTRVQRNRLDGSRSSRFSAVDRRNSIVVRLRTAIGHLEASDPTGGWGRYLSAHGVRWRRIVVAGHSQGGGEAAYISHIHRVRGVLMFSSPVDSDDSIDASWMRSAGVTPASRMYGFDDSGDVFYARIVTSWDVLGLASSHQIITHRDLGGPDASHLRTITDQTPHTRAGRPEFAGIWRRMLTEFANA